MACQIQSGIHSSSAKGVYIYYFYDLVLKESGFRVKGTKKLIKFKAVNLTHSNGRFEQL